MRTSDLRRGCSRLRPRRLLRRVLLTAGLIGMVAGPARAQTPTLPTACTNFTDDPVQPGITMVQAQPIAELRACIDALRAQVSLTATAWTDGALAPQQTWIRAAHILELRASLAEVFAARGRTSPAYTDPTLTAQASRLVVGSYV